MNVNEHEILYNITIRHKMILENGAFIVVLHVPVAVEPSITHTLKLVSNLMPLPCVRMGIFTSVDKRDIWVYLSVSLLVLLIIVYIF
jgi:hypothetical protein